MNIKYILIISFLLVFLTIVGYSQTNVHGTVLDAGSKEPLAFVSIVIKGTKAGCITNEDGAFRIQVHNPEDILIFSYLGYKSLEIKASLIESDPNVLLKGMEIKIPEVNVKATNLFLYKVFAECRKVIERSGKYVSRAYFQLETEMQDQPVELIEAYYNAFMEKAGINELKPVNGRIAWVSSNDSGNFVSWNTTQALCQFKLTQDNQNMPYNPFQLGRSKLEKLYKLQEMYDNTGEDIYHIKFTPVNDTNYYFKGEAWINKNNFKPVKIHLVIEDAKTHPFEEWPARDRDHFKNVCLDYSITFKVNGDQNVVDHIEFKYFYNVLWERNPFWPKAKNIRISTSSILYFFYFNNPFKSYFNITPVSSDYLTITRIPFISYYWEGQNGIIPTEKQLQTLEYFKNNGFLINFGTVINWTRPHFFRNVEKYRVGTRKNHFFETNTLWSPSDRWIIRQSQRERDSLELLENIHSSEFRSQKCHLEAVILLDVNNDDSLKHFSATILDPYKSFYNLPKDNFTDCFVNIYFDIYEIGRRKMEKKINSGHYNAQQIEEIYKQAMKDIGDEATKYLKKVSLGKNSRELLRWNNYVIDNLNIDNISIFKVKFDKE